MKLTNKQKIDLETIEYFIPKGYYPEITDEDRKMFLEVSEKGLHKDKVEWRKLDGFNALIQGKRWRGIHIHEMWKPALFPSSYAKPKMKDDLPTDFLWEFEAELLSSVFEFLLKELNLSKTYK